MNLRFDGQVVAVSGAGHGLGRAIAEAFARLGAHVFGCGPDPAGTAPVPGGPHPTAPGLDGPYHEAAAQGGLLREVPALGKPPQAVPAAGGAFSALPAPIRPEPGPSVRVEMAVVDLTDRAAAARWIAEVEAAAGSPVSVLVNNAGGVAGQVFQPVEAVADADWDAVMAVNVGAAFALSRAAAPGMKRAGRGRIVTISSGAGLQASLTGIQAYASAKHAVIGLTRQLAHELGPHGITVNSVAPGLIPCNPASTAQWEAYSPERQAALLGGIALRRLGTPGDIANAVLFLASPMADFVNGQVLQVDGGK